MRLKIALKRLIYHRVNPFRFNQLEQIEVRDMPNLTNLALYSNRLTALKLAQCPSLSYIGLHENSLTEDQFVSLVQALPDRGSANAVFIAVNSKAGKEGNKCSKALVAQLKEKGWVAYDYNGNPFAMLPYKGYDYVPALSSRSLTFTTDHAVDTTIKLKITSQEPYVLENVEQVSLDKSFNGEDVYEVRILGKEITIKGDILMLDCSSSRVKKISFNGDALLTNLVCSDNLLEQLDLTPCRQLTSLDCAKNKLQTLILPEGLPLKYFAVYDNRITQEVAYTIARGVSDQQNEGETKAALLFDASEGSLDQNKFDTQAVEEFTQRGFRSFALVNKENRMRLYKGWDYTPRVAPNRVLSFTTNKVGSTVLVEATAVKMEI